MEFVDPEKGVREEAFAGIRNLKRRQTDAEDMLAHGLSNILREIQYLDLELTPAVLAAHKKHTLELATSNDRPDASSVPYTWIASGVDSYLPSIEWMSNAQLRLPGRNVSPGKNGQKLQKLPRQTRMPNLPSPRPRPLTAKWGRFPTCGRFPIGPVVGQVSKPAPDCQSGNLENVPYLITPAPPPQTSSTARLPSPTG